MENIERASRLCLSELQKSCLDGQDAAQLKLQDWLKRVDHNLQEVKVMRTWVQIPLCLRERNATDFIRTGLHPRVQLKNAELEKENKQLRKEVLEQKLLLLEYKSSTEAKLEEARVREENLLKSNKAFKQEMKQQAEETQRMMKQMMEMFQKQAQP